MPEPLLPDDTELEIQNLKTKLLEKESELNRLKADNYNLQQKLKRKDIELDRLHAETNTLRKRTLTPELLENSKISKMFNYSTGFTYEKFNQMCTIFGVPNNPNSIPIDNPLHYKRTDCEIMEMPLRNQLLFVLMKLRNNEGLKNLAFRFGISVQNSSTIYKAWINHMFDILGEIPIWPHRDVITQHITTAYRQNYPTTFGILDCTELRTQRPTSLVLQSQSFSTYKSTNTLKALVACDPRGAVIFSSALFTGAMSDKEIVRECGLLPQLKTLVDRGYLQRGDGLMADKGFLIEKELNDIGLQLNIPPFARSNRQMAAGDVLSTKRIAKHRVHVERAIAKIKKFKIVSDKIPNSQLCDMNHIWYIVSMLSNFQPHILRP